MKMLLKIVGYIVLTIVIVVGGLIAYAMTMLPDVGNAPELKIAATPSRIEHGKYLANYVTGCVGCHSERDWTKYSGPLVPGTVGQGGETFDQKFGFPGAFYSRNITPYGLSRYTDGELYRVITTGVTKEGKAMFPVMPYTHYGKMDTEDIYSIIAYIRTLPEIKHDVVTSVADFPMNIIIHAIPQKAAPEKRPDTTDKLAYGKYLVNATGCIECHTRDKNGQIIMELAFSGGREFKMHDGSVIRSSNITPDKTTGIGNWTEEIFVNRFAAYADSNYVPPTIGKGELNTLMPWTMYGKMKRGDLAAIYTYLHNLPPQTNLVTKGTLAAH